MERHNIVVDPTKMVDSIATLVGELNKTNDRQFQSGIALTTLVKMLCDSGVIDFNDYAKQMATMTARADQQSAERQQNPDE